jgi:predicted transcriptional regulator
MKKLKTKKLKTLAKKRKEAGFTQEEIAYLTGLCQSSISRIEHGSPRHSKAAKVKYMQALQSL